MRRSLALKLILAFLFVNLLVLGLAALTVRWLTAREFNRLILDQAQNRFVQDMAIYYQINGSWIGVNEFLRLRSSQPLPGDGVIPPADLGQNRPLQPQPVPQAAGKDVLQSGSLVFALVDVQGRVLVPAGRFRMGDQLALSELSGTAKIEVNGVVVGHAIPTGDFPPLDVREERYLQRTDLALVYAALGATGIALLLGIWLARTLTRPLGDLTMAIRAMAGGQLEQRVQVNSQDEIGEMAQAFNQMSVELARANQSRRQMTADIAHDLRTPLTVISGYVEALRDQVLDPTVERFDTIFSEVQHLLHLVEDLRTLSLADAGELKLNRQPTIPRVLLERMTAAYAQRAEQHQVRLIVDADDQLPMIQMDVERMAQVLGNLISNALRYTPPGGQICMAADRVASGLRLRVQDTGEGISSESLPYIFDRFYRADASRQREESESGLGLAIARSLVEAHGGTISVQSILGQGTTFSILLPN